MAVEFLTYANRQKVADALTERGYSVTRMTVNRWARGNEMPDIATRMILELFGHDPTTTKDASAPGWAKAMEGRLRLELRLNRALIESDVDEIEAMRAELHDVEPGGPLPDADGQEEGQYPRDGSAGTRR